MKRVTVAIIATLYLLVTCGVSVNFHYCMGKLRSVDLGYSQEDRCGKCGMSTGLSSGCCHDSTHWVKVNDDHQFVQSAIMVAAPFVALADHSFPDLSGHGIEPDAIASTIHPPPDISSPRDIRLLQCVFRI